MKLVVLTDIHNHVLTINQIGRTLMEADYVLLAGDLTTFGNAQDAQKVIDAIANYNQNILAVPGNCDPASVATFLNEKKLNLDNQVREIDGYFFFGIGGSLPAPGTTPNELYEEQFSDILNQLRPKIKEPHKWIFLIHQPPFNTIADRLSANRHVGSKALRNFVKEVQPLVYFTGHIHEGRGTDQIGQTVVVNPGPFHYGNFAVAEIAGTSVNVELRKI